VNWRDRICYWLARLGIHSADCERCGARGVCGSELLKRLEEVNWRTQKAEEVPDPKLQKTKETRKAS